MMDPEDKRSVGEQVLEVTETSNEKKWYTDCHIVKTRLLTDDPAGPELSVDEQLEITESLNEKKCCTDCQTSRTPLWRGGPAGPKSLCNACGIKYNKKRRAQMSGFDKNGRSSKVVKRNGDLKLKMKLTVNKKQPQHHDHHQQHHDHHQQHRHQHRERKRSSYERGKPWWNKLREEEQAAILLMAISCGGSMYS